MLYKFYLLIPIIFLLLDNKKNIKKNNFILIFVAFLLWIYSTFREFILPVNMIGADYYSYESWFINKTSINEVSNCGFNALILLVKLICNNYLFFVGVCSAFIIITFYKFVKENSENCSYSMFILIAIGLLDFSFN